MDPHDGWEGTHNERDGDHGVIIARSRVSLAPKQQLPDCTSRSASIPMASHAWQDESVRSHCNAVSQSQSLADVAEHGGGLQGHEYAHSGGARLRSFQVSALHPQSRGFSSFVVPQRSATAAGFETWHPEQPQDRSQHHGDREDDDFECSSAMPHGSHHASTPGLLTRSQVASCCASSTTHCNHDDLILRVSPQEVIRRIEQQILQPVLQDWLDHDRCPVVANRHFAHVTQCRSLTSILLVATYCHELLQQNRDIADSHRPTTLNAQATAAATAATTTTTLTSQPTARSKTTTTRELYYHYITHFRNQQECDTAIWELASHLQVPRYALGLHASPKGWMCGCFDLYDAETHRLVIDGRSFHTAHGVPITTDIIDASARSILTSRDAQFLLVVEKEGIYTRLCQDGFFRDMPCILITGKGFPDLATRQLVQILHCKLKLPVYGLCDCNPFGVSLLQSYQYSSGMSSSMTARQGSRNAKHHATVTANLRMEWIGLLPSSIPQLELPRHVHQLMTKLDQRRLQTIRQQRRGNSEVLRCGPVSFEAELDAMTTKVELEALHWKGMDFLARWVGQQIRSRQTMRGEQC